MPLWNCCEMFIVFSSVTERTERLYLPIWASDLNGKTLSLHRKKLALFHDAPIHLFLKGKHFFLIACNPELIVRWLASSAVFRSVTTRTVKSVNITECASGYRLEITKGEKVRTQLCIECVSNANVEWMRNTEKNNNIDQDQNSIVSLTHSLILTTHSASPPVGGSSHKKMAQKRIRCETTRRQQLINRSGTV